jgi:hypothetical protein
MPGQRWPGVFGVFVLSTLKGALPMATKKKAAKKSAKKPAKKAAKKKK